MKRTTKKIFVLLLILLIQLPALIRLNHHHTHTLCSAMKAKHLHQAEENCPACSFEFSLFDYEEPETLTDQKVNPGILPVHAPADRLFDIIHYSYTLRAPPAFTDKIFLS